MLITNLNKTDEAINWKNSVWKSLWVTVNLQNKFCSYNAIRKYQEKCPTVVFNNKQAVGIKTDFKIIL